MAPNKSGPFNLLGTLPGPPGHVPFKWWFVTPGGRGGYAAQIQERDSWLTSWRKKGYKGTTYAELDTEILARTIQVLKEYHASEPR